MTHGHQIHVLGIPLPKSVFFSKVYSPPKHRFQFLTLQLPESSPSFSQVAYNIASYFTVNMVYQSLFLICCQTSLLGCVCWVYDNFLIDISERGSLWWLLYPVSFTSFIFVILFTSLFFLSYMVYAICNLFKQHCFHGS